MNFCVEISGFSFFSFLATQTNYSRTVADEMRFPLSGRSAVVFPISLIGGIDYGWPAVQALTGAPQNISFERKIKRQGTNKWRTKIFLW